MSYKPKNFTFILLLSQPYKTPKTQTDTPYHPRDLRPHDPKNRLAKMISIPDSFLTVSQAGLALGVSPISWIFLSQQ